MNPVQAQPRVSGILITQGAAIILLAGIQAASPIIGPLLLPVYLTLVSGMLLHWFERKGLSTRLPLLFTLLVFFSIVAVFIAMTAGSFIQFIPGFFGYLWNPRAVLNPRARFSYRLGSIRPP